LTKKRSWDAHSHQKSRAKHQERYSWMQKRNKMWVCKKKRDWKKG